MLNTTQDRVRYYYGKCVNCLVIVERAYSDDEFTFTENCSCGAAGDTIKRVEVREI